MTEPNRATAHLDTDARPSTLIDQVADWLMTQALGQTEFEEIIEGCWERLSAAGIPLWRAHVTFRTLHPLYDAMAKTWVRGTGLELASYEHLEDGGVPEQFQASPLWHMIQSNIPFLRRRLTGEEAVLDFPMLTELRDKGATDYLAFLIHFGGGPTDGIAGSWATDRPSGFSDQDIRSLLRIQQRLGVVCKLRIKEEIARNVVTAYLGRDAGLRVLDGQIRRGDGERIHSVIWYSDLRGSTQMAETKTPEEHIQALNDYFEATGGAVLSQDGQILDFIGDAVLAIFPIRDGLPVDEACRKALAASREAQQRLADVNDRRRGAGATSLSMGIALHVGEVVFGNIGLPERVSFTVIGSSVNEVVRLEALTKDLGRPVLASQAFAGHTQIEWKSLGRHPLRGVDEPFEVLAPTET